LSSRFPNEHTFVEAQANARFLLVRTVYDRRPQEKKNGWQTLVQFFDISGASILDHPLESVRANSYYQYALALAAVSRLEEAEVTVCKALELQPPQSTSRSATLYHALGRILQATGRPLDSEKAFRAAVDLVPQSAMFPNDLAWLLVTYPEHEFHKPAEAVVLAQKAAENGPQAANVWNTLGVALYRAGRYTEAIDALQKSETLGGGKELGFNALFIAMSHWQLGNAVSSVAESAASDQSLLEMDQAQHQDEARRWYQQAVEWIQKRQLANEELRRFQEEASDLLGVDQATQD